MPCVCTESEAEVKLPELESTSATTENPFNLLQEKEKNGDETQDETQEQKGKCGGEEEDGGLDGGNTNSLSSSLSWADQDEED